ncbi:hypothetical protein [Pseudomonas arsenicoxydans]|uniref:Uncharacterized protein n=1 Tax=Pseudomonas arsenicoxydans TaxID=702115 RepID=A0A4P6G6Q0_9PSED|nr:hypothetical protein [Pseudomonas arsenicoxydans]QAY86817.1 hypothetical protein CUN61_23975 [Pseudomonas arsenicoxydans]
MSESQHGENKNECEEKAFDLDGWKHAYLQSERELDLKFFTFAKSAELNLQVLNADFFSEGTRKDQRLLLIVAFMMLFVSLGSFVISGVEVKTPGDIKLTVSAPENFLKLGFMVYWFFEVTYFARALSDWTAFSVKKKIAEAELRLLILDQDTIGGTGVSGEFGENFLSARRSQAEPKNKINLVEARKKYDKKILIIKTKEKWFKRQIFRIKANYLIRALLEVISPVSFGAYALFSSNGVIGW